MYRTKRIPKPIESTSEFNMADDMMSIRKHKFYFYSPATNTEKLHLRLAVIK